jgi:hypothetical protein
MHIKQPHLIPDDEKRDKVNKAFKKVEAIEKSKKIVKPFKGFSRKAERVQNSSQIRRYLHGLLEKDLKTKPLTEVKQLMSTED